MINSYNDSFIKKFNNGEQVKSYNQTFINQSNSDDEKGSYNRFFANDNDASNNDVGSEYKNPFLNKNENIRRDDEYVNSYMKDITSYENNNFKNGFEQNNYNGNAISSDFSNENKYSGRNFTDEVPFNRISNNEVLTNNNETNIFENYNAPFGNEEDRSQGRFIRSFMKGATDEQKLQYQNNEDFIVRNEELDKELSLNTNYFTQGTSGDVVSTNNNDEHSRGFGSEYNNEDDKYSKITFPSNLGKTEELTYDKAFEVKDLKTGNQESNNVNFRNNDVKSNNSGLNNELKINTSFKVNAIADEEKDSYNKYFENGVNNNESNDEKKTASLTDGYEEDYNSSKSETDMSIDEMDEILRRYREEESVVDRRSYAPLEQGSLNKEFFSNFFKSRDDYEVPEENENTNINTNTNNSTPSWYNLDTIEQRRANKEFFSKYFNNEPTESAEPVNEVMGSNDKGDYEKLDRMLERYREEEKSQEVVNTSNYNGKYYEDSYKDIYKSNGYDTNSQISQLDYFSNKFNKNFGDNKDDNYRKNIDYSQPEDTGNYFGTNFDRRSNVNYSRTDEDRRSKVNYFGSDEDRRNKINYPQGNERVSMSNTMPIMQINKRLENVKEHQYLNFNSLGKKVLRGGFDIVSTDVSNDTIKFPSTGVYRVDVNIEYNFIVTEYIAGKDYQIVFTLEDGNGTPIFTMNKVAPTSSKSTYIADNIRNSELIEVTKLPYTLKLKLNNFSFSNGVPLDISSLGVSVTKISD